MFNEREIELQVVYYPPVRHSSILTVKVKDVEDAIEVAKALKTIHLLLKSDEDDFFDNIFLQTYSHPYDDWEDYYNNDGSDFCFSNYL